MMLLERGTVVGRAITIIVADVGDASVSLYLQAKRALFHLDPPDKLADAFPRFYFELPRKVVFGKITVLRNLVNGQVLAYVGKDVVYGFIDILIRYHILLLSLEVIGNVR